MAASAHFIKSGWLASWHGFCEPVYQWIKPVELLHHDVQGRGGFAFGPADKVLRQPVTRLRIAALGCLQCACDNAAPVVQGYGIEQHAHVIAFGAPVGGVALDVFGLLALCHGQPLVGVELKYCGPGICAAEYARHNAAPVPQRNPYRLPRPAAMQVGQLKWCAR